MWCHCKLVLCCDRFEVVLTESIRPPLRDALILRFRDYLDALAEGVSCTWPLSMAEAVKVDEKTGMVKLTAEFENHVTKGDNWRYRESIFGVFPEVAGSFKVER